jgi:hypothetical protein
MKSVAPDLRQTLQNYKKNDIFGNYHFQKIGKIISVNFKQATCRVEIVHKYEDKNKNLSTRPLLSCPIKLNYTNAGGVKQPINKGDYCVVLFNDVSIDEWFRNGGTSLPVSQRQHHISDGVAIPFIFASNSVMPDYNNDNTEVFYNNTQIILKDKITITNNAADIKTILDSLITDYNEAVKSGLQSLIILDSIGAPCTIDSASADSLLDNAKDSILTNIGNLFE